MDFWAKFDPYEMNALLVSGDVMVKLLKLTEFQNPLTGLNFQGTGKLTTPWAPSCCVPRSCLAAPLSGWTSDLPWRWSRGAT